MRIAGKWRPLDVLLPPLAAILLWPILARYEPPVADRDFASFDGGSTDFACNYLGSLAFIRGFDPYLNGRPEFRDPWRREIQMDGVMVSQFYLPGHYIALSPLAWIYGDDWRSASRTYFRIHVALLVFLAWIVAWAASRGITDPGRVWRLFALTLILLGLHVGVRMGLERGQSDVIQSVLLWAGVALAARGRLGPAAFLLVAGTSLKGYGVLLVAGLGLALLGRGAFRPFLLGSLAAALPILGLTWSFFATGIRVALYKAGDFSYHWTIHGFKHVGWAISPDLADGVRYLLTSIAVAAALACWMGYGQARAAGRADSTFRLVAAATVSLAAMVGFSSSSHPYNLVLILPGLVWMAGSAQGREMSWSREALLASAFLMIVLRTPFRLFAPAAYGLVLLVAWSVMYALDGRGSGPQARNSLPGSELVASGTD